MLNSDTGFEMRLFGATAVVGFMRRFVINDLFIDNSPSPASPSENFFSHRHNHDDDRKSQKGEDEKPFVVGLLSDYDSLLEIIYSATSCLAILRAVEASQRNKQHNYR